MSAQYRRASDETCRHCRSNAADDDGSHLCPECMDLAVYGAECPFCNQTPTGREKHGCNR